MLEFITQITDQISTFAPSQYALFIIAATAALVVSVRHKLALILLAVQYLLLAVILGPRVYGPLVMVRAGLGFAVCLILLVSIGHIDAAPLDKSDYKAPAVLFRLAIAGLSALIAYGLWEADVLQIGWLEGLVSYFLVAIGLLLAVTSTDPFRVGLGILTCINGFETASVFMQQGLLVIGMWGVVDILLALTIAASIESWSEARAQVSDA